MKRLLAVAVLALGIGGCKSHCEDYTIFANCKDQCITKGTRCDCNHKEKCCEWKKEPGAPKIIVSRPE